MTLKSRIEKLESQTADKAPADPSMFQEQMASMLASILPPSIVDRHLLLQAGPAAFPKRLETLWAAIGGAK